jgi:ABC-type sugar transport system permease subunit
VVVIVVRLWIAIPPMFVLLYPAVLSVPHEYYEAARIDGATAWRQFISITLPVIATSIRVATVFGVIWTLGVFGEIFVLTQGGPQGGTETIGLFLYRIAFGNFDWGEAAAVGTLAVLFTLAIAIPQIRLLGRDAAPAEVGP